MCLNRQIAVEDDVTKSVWQAWRPQIFDGFECSGFSEPRGSTCCVGISTQSSLKWIYKLTSVE